MTDFDGGKLYEPASILDLAEPEPDQNDEVKCCPNCEKPNQFGELCFACQREMEMEGDHAR